MSPSLELMNPSYKNESEIENAQALTQPDR